MHLAENLRYLRQKHNLSQAEAAEKLGIPRTTLGDYERGHTEPDMELLVRIARIYEAGIESLLTLKLEKIAWEDSGPGALRVLAMTVDQNQKSNIELVKTKAMAGYIDNFQDPEFVSELPRMYFPTVQGHFRAFEIEGDSMLPMEPGSIVICRYVERLTDIKNNRPYILVSQREGVVYKRLQPNSAQKTLLCQSDNALYPPFQIPWEEVREIWEYHAHLAFNEPKAALEQLIEEKVMDIQKKVTELHRHYVGKELQQQKN